VHGSDEECFDELCGCGSVGDSVGGMGVGIVICPYWGCQRWSHRKEEEDGDVEKPIGDLN
jgi:hypothetical protein